MRLIVWSSGDLAARDQDLIRDLADIVPALERQARECHRRALRELARKRLQSIRKKVGGLVGEAPRRAEKAAELTEKLLAQLEWLARADFRRRILMLESQLMAQAFELPVPDFKSLGDAPSRALADAQRELAAVHGPGDGLTSSIRRTLAQGDHRKAASKIRRRLQKLTPFVDLLEALEEAEEPTEG